MFEASLYEGMSQLLSQLKQRGYKLAVATLKYEETAQRMLTYLNVAQYFDVICGALADVKLSKSQLLGKCMSFSGSDEASSLLVGDSSYDALGAKEAGIDFLGVTYGFGFTNQQEVDEFPNVGCAETVNEIGRILS